jgi:hypothetical protein
MIPLPLAASSIVVPSGTVTSTPSIIKVAVEMLFFLFPFLKHFCLAGFLLDMLNVFVLKYLEHQK